MKKIFTSLLCGLMSSAAFAQWSPSSMQGDRIRVASNATSYYSLDLTTMRSTLAKAQETGKNSVPVEVKIPTLDGKVERFAVYSAPVVVKSLADRYQLGSYVGVGIDNPTSYVRFSVAPNDFQSMMLRNGVYEFIEPQNTEKSVYGVHPKSSKAEGDKAFVCSTTEKPMSKKELDNLYSNGKSFTNNPLDFSKASDKKYRTMRLAMSVNGEYTQYFGGVPQALAAINATVTRCNFVFEKDFALKVILQDFPQLIYTDPNTDPYSPDMGSWNVELQNTLTTVIGNAAYDIGHMFGASGGGGNAGCIGCVCINPTGPGTKAKGSGYTSPGDGVPMGDNFDIDYVAHEMGHQLGGNHTFSHSLESSGQNVEPGSGSTIMGYAGITGSNTDVQPHSDAYFHVNSIIQIQNNLNSKTCDIETPVANNPPVIIAMADVTIPKGTAFVLTASATDAENDTLTYTWEQTDNATTSISKTNLGNTTSGATFRSLMPNASPTRYFPKLATVLSGEVKNISDFEAVSTVARLTNFKVTVRDNNPDVMQQQSQTATQRVIVNANGPFKITSTKVYTNAPGPLAWDVVGTNAAPFNVAEVKIDYTTDNGITWVVLAANTPNDGSEEFSFAGFPSSSTIKVRISAIGNVFYTIAPLTVTTIVLCDGSAPAGLAVNSITLTSASTTWEAISGASYKVRYRKVGDATWTEMTASTNVYAISGLVNSTAYEVQVASVCTGTTGTYSPSVNFTTLEPTYCAAGANNTGFEKISNVTFATINNNCTSTAGYEDFTNVVGNVSKTMTYTFTAKSGNSYADDEVRVWIDFNQDKDFDDAGEAVLVTTKSVAPWTGSITIPADALTGTTRMRVRMHDSKLTPNTTPCGNSSYGQVEDYTLNIGTLAVSESNNATKVQVYPNPATDILNVSRVSNNSDYSIYSVSGQLVAKGKITDNKVAVSKLQKGVYFLTVDYNGETSKVKFIKK